MPQNSGREGHLPVDPIEEEGIQDGKVKGAYKSRGRGNNDSQGGHGHDEKGGYKGKVEAQGLFDPLDLNQVREPDQKGVEDNQKPLGGAFHEDQPQTEILDYLKDPFPKILREKEKKFFEEIEEYSRFIFEPNQKGDDTEIEEKQQKSGVMQFVVQGFPFPLKCGSHESDEENDEQGEAVKKPFYNNGPEGRTSTYLLGMAEIIGPDKFSESGGQDTVGGKTDKGCGESIDEAGMLNRL